MQILTALGGRHSDIQKFKAGIMEFSGKIAVDCSASGYLSVGKIMTIAMDDSLEEAVHKGHIDQCSVSGVVRSTETESENKLD